MQCLTDQLDGSAAQSLDKSINPFTAYGRIAGLLQDDLYIGRHYIPTKPCPDLVQDAPVNPAFLPVRQNLVDQEVIQRRENIRWIWPRRCAPPCISGVTF